jgi:glycosyltransferase involved in cell wall biosynthesis
VGKMKKLKICHVSLAVFPDKRDGAAYFCRGLYDTLKKRGHDITLLTVKWGSGFDDPNIHTITVPNSRFLWFPKFIAQYRKYLKTHEFDIIHGSGSRGSLPIIFSGKPYISTIYDLGPFEASFTRIPVIKWIERLNARKSNKIITISEISRRGIIDYMHAESDKIHNVYCAYDPSFRPRPSEAQNLKAQLGLEGPTLFYVGRIAFYKGVEDIIKAFYIAKKNISNLNLVVGGSPTLKMKEVYEKWKIDYPEVKFTGMIDGDNIPVYYSMADLFVTYSFASEGFGITPVEAIACGTPVVCSAMPAYKEIFEDHAIFVEPKRPDLLANTFIHFFENKDSYVKKIPQAQEFIKRYTWDKVTDRVEEVYEQYLNKFH